ncbi:MAG: alpha/beta hydrolase-fold protein [Pseudomonadota bacterium]
MQIKIIAAIGALFCIALAGAPRAAPAPHAAAPPRAYLTDVRSWVMTSGTGHRRYQISVALPDGYDTKHAPYPVLYVTDANAEFGLAVETARLLAGGKDIPGLVIVGIGYPNPGQGFKASGVPRTYDLTPTALPPKPGKTLRSGGAPEFLNFLRGALVPRIEKDFNVSPADRGLAGHSFGGLFATYALFHNDGLFARFLIASPSLWWDDHVALKMEDAYAASKKPLPAKIFLSVGALEEKTTHLPMTSDMKAFGERLRARHYRGFQIDTRIFDGDDHISVVGAAFSHGLRAIYAAPEAPTKSAPR